jgi:ribonuclease HI
MADAVVSLTGGSTKKVTMLTDAEPWRKVTLITSSAGVISHNSRDRAPGGWAYILRYGSHSAEDAGGAAMTTSLSMEIQAVINGLEILKVPCEVLLISNWGHVLDLVSFDRFFWEDQGSTGKRKRIVPIDDAGLWWRLEAVAKKHIIHIELLWKQSYDLDADRCDYLAGSQADEYLNSNSQYLIG